MGTIPSACSAVKAFLRSAASLGTGGRAAVQRRAAADSRHLCLWTLWPWTGSASPSHLSGGKCHVDEPSASSQPSAHSRPGAAQAHLVSVGGSGKRARAPPVTQADRLGSVAAQPFPGTNALSGAGCGRR